MIQSYIHIDLFFFFIFFSLVAYYKISSIVPCAIIGSCCFHALAIIESAAMNTGVHVSFRIVIFSGYMSSSGIAVSYGSFIPSFQRNLHTAFDSECSNLHSHQLCKGVPFSPHSLQHLLLLIVLIIAILTEMR